MSERCRAGERRVWRERFERLVPGLNGGWALVARWEDGALLAATDRMRSIPLFFVETPEGVVLCASARDARHRSGTRGIDTVSAAEFLLTMYVTGEATLFEGVRQLQPAEILDVDPGRTAARLRRRRYYRFLPEEPGSADQEELEVELERLLDGCFEALLSHPRRGRWVVPLSGGLDSRLVAGMLKRHGVEDVLCFSYGREDNEDAAISRRVALALGYEWRCVEYERDTWLAHFDDGSVPAYWRYACNGVSVPHVQDLPAVLSLVAAGACGPADVFFPGHSADMMAGSHIPDDYERLDEPGGHSVEEEIIRSHYRRWPFARLPADGALAAAVREKVRRLSAPASHEGGSRSSPLARYEMWDAENRQALFIVNAVRAYEYVGARWRTLWDHAFMDFFMRVPVELRLGERLYLDTLRRRIFTGPAHRLAEIPVAGLGAWTERASERYGRQGPDRSLRGRLRSLAVAGLSSAGVFDAILSWKHRNRPVGDHILGQYCFAGGRDPSELTVGDVFRAFGTLDKVPTELRPLLEPSLDRRLDFVHLTAMSSAVVLGEQCAED